MRLLALLLLLVSVVGVDGSIGGGECDAMNADGSCDAPPPSSLDEDDDDHGDDDFDVPPALPDDVAMDGIIHEVECVDKEPRCPGWAAEGECDINPDYMLCEFRVNRHCGLRN